MSSTYDSGSHAGGSRAQRENVVSREKEEYGGIKWGSAFFGWLTATGVAVLLTSLLAGAGTAVGLATNTAVGEATNKAGTDAETVGVAGGIGLLVILFLAYLAGGYVAGRMARFDGAKQGVAVWLWALVIAILVAIVAALVGDQYNVLSQLNSFPRLPINEGDLTTGSLIAAVLLAVVSLVGAVLGGLLGMRYHRNIDKTGFGA